MEILNCNPEVGTILGACNFQIENLLVEFHILFGRYRGKLLPPSLFGPPCPYPFSLKWGGETSVAWVEVSYHCTSAQSIKNYKN